jgi:hypothetical protein
VKKAGQAVRLGVIRGDAHWKVRDGKYSEEGCRRELRDLPAIPFVRLKSRYGRKHEEIRLGVLCDHMTMLLPIVAVVLAAFCVWLGVRIINRRERWAKLTLAVVVGLPVLYVASFGPACWIASRTEIGIGLLQIVYHPLITAMPRDDRIIRIYSASDGCVRAFYYPDGIIHWYSTIGAKPGWRWVCAAEFEQRTDQLVMVKEWRAEWRGGATE